MIDKLIEQLGSLKQIQTEKELRQMWDHYQKDAPNSFGQNHFDLANVTGIAATKWEEFKKHPLIKNYTQEQMAIIQDTNRTKAMVRFGDAVTSTDIQVAKLARDMAKTEDHRSSKPFTIQFLPMETLRYKRALMQVVQRTLEGAPAHDILDIVWAVIPPTKEMLDVAGKTGIKSET